MENRKKLHDYSIAMICMAILNVFTFVGSVISGLVDGTTKEMLSKAEPDIATAVKIVLIVTGVLMALLVFSDAFIGFKGLKISREPNTDKGYITIAKIFFVLSVIALVSSVFSLTNDTPIVDRVLTLANVLIDTIIYALFIKSAKAVYNDEIQKAQK